MLYLKDFVEEAEAKWRRYWLILTFCIFLLPTPAAFAQFFIPEAGPLTIKLVAKQLLYIIKPMAFWLVALWHCAYKKHGNKLLSFWLGISVLGLFASVEVLRSPIEGSARVYLLIYAGIYLLVFITWFVLSLKLLKINRILQAHGAVALAADRHLENAVGYKS